MSNTNTIRNTNHKLTGRSFNCSNLKAFKYEVNFSKVIRVKAVAKSTSDTTRQPTNHGLGGGGGQLTKPNFVRGRAILV